MGNPRYQSIHAVLITVMMLSFLHPVSGDPGSEPQHPDLAVISLKVIPRINHYALSIVVRNVGESASPSADGSIFDEFDLRTGEEELITNFQIPSLDPGEEYSGEFSWTRETTGYHRIWASADVDGEVQEIDKENNVAFILIQLPQVKGLSASIDGVSDPEVSGSYFSGIHLPVNFSIDYSGMALPDLLRVYASIDDGPSRYAPTGSDGVSHITYDMGDLSPGIHLMRINASSSGIPLELLTHELTITSTPKWFMNLSYRSSSFNSSLSAYVLKGYYDIPAMSYQPVIDGIDDLEPLRIFGEDRDLHVTAYILPDGTTTIEVEGDVMIGTPASSTSYRITGSSFLSSPHEDALIRIGGNGDMMMDLGSMMRPGKIEYEIFENITVPLVFSPIVDGHSICSLEIELGANGLISLDGDVDINGNGSDDFSISSGLFGLDNPVIYSNFDVDWLTTHRIGHGIGWSNSGTVRSSMSAGLADVGISDYEPVDDEMASEMGFDMADTLAGSIGSAYIPVEEGSISSIYHQIDEEIDIVHQSNLYKSNPELLYLSGNRTLVVWSEAESYSTDLLERASSMRLFYSIRNGTGDFSEPEPLFHTESTDSRPVIIRDRDGSKTALIWQRDSDGNVNTRDDNRIMFSTFETENWTDPEMISRDEGINLLPTAFYSSNGDIWSAWSVEGKIAYRVHLVDDGRWSDIKYLRHMDENGVLFNPTMAGGDDELPNLIYVRSGMSWEDDYTLVFRRGDLARESLLSDEEIITKSVYWMEDPSGYMDGKGILHVAWRGRDGGDGEIFATRKISDGSPQWLPKLRITEDSAYQIQPALIHVNKGSYRMGWYSLTPFAEPGNLTSGGKLDLGERNLSRAAEIVSVSLSSSDYSIGDTILLNARVRNMGMSPQSDVTVVLKRLMRDPITGEKITYDLSWKSVSFQSLLEVKSVDFSVTIAEHQLGLIVVTEGPRWGSPAYSSSKYVSLPAVQDPVIGSLKLKGDVEDCRDVTIQVRVDNPGIVPTGDRYVKLISTEPGLPALFEGNKYEPVNFHSDDPGFEVNRTIINIGPGSSSMVAMNLTITPGRYRIWIEMESYPWEEEPRRSQGSIDIDCLPIYRLKTDRNLHLVDDLVNLSAEVEIMNAGGCSMADLPVPDPDLPEGMEYPLRNLTLVQNFTSNTWTYIDTRDLDVRDIDPGDTMTTRLDYGGQRPVRGLIDHTMSLSGYRLNSGGGYWIESRIIVQEKGGLDLGSDPVICEKAVLGNCMTLDIKPNDQRIYRAVFITIFNGFVNDDVVKSQGMATGVGGSGSRSIDVPLNLDEGYYTITVVLSAYPDDADISTGSTPVQSYEKVYHITIKEPVDSEADEDGEYDWDEIQRAALIAAALTMIVFGAAVALKFADKSGEGKN